MARRTHKPEDEDKITESRMFVDGPTAVKLRAAYEEALKDGKRTFMFEGETLDIVYAKYMISYLKQNGL